MWEYTAGHSQLLLRSTKSDRNPTTVDVLFKNVSAIRLQTVIDGLTIAEAFEEDRQDIANQCGVTLRDAHRVFIIDSLNGTGSIIAGAVAWHEDQRDYNDASHFALRIEN